MDYLQRILAVLAVLAGILSLQSQSSSQLGVSEPYSRTITNPDHVHIFWDASFSMRDRDLEKEVVFLKHYLNINAENAIIKLHVFAGVIDKTIDLGSGKEAVSVLDKNLENLFYNSSSDLNTLSKIEYEPNSVLLLFSDGNALSWDVEIKRLPPVIAVSSVAGANVRDLRDLSGETSGLFIDLYRNDPSSDLDSFRQAINSNSTETFPIIYGVVHNNSKPIQGATVRQRNSFNEVTTGANGMYRIRAPKGSLLEIRAFGMEPLDTLVGERQQIHIPMKTEGELLNEVTVTGKRSDGETVQTAFGEKKKGALGYSVSNRITAKDIRADQVELWQILQKMPGVVVVDPYSPVPRYKFRKTITSSITGSTFPAMVVDGIVYDQSQQQPPFINPQQIKSITLVKSMMATNRYGQLAAAGAIVIELKDMDYSPEETTDLISPVKGNDFNEQLVALENADSLPDTFTALSEAKSIETAREHFQSLVGRQKELSIGFFLDAASALKVRHPEFSLEVLMNIAEVAPTNEKALKTLAYALEERGRFQQASHIYEKVVNLAPGKAQSYLDLARNYKEVGRYKLAATLYRQMIANSIPKVDFSNVGETVFNEFKQLLSLHKHRIDYSYLPSEFLKVGFKRDIRIAVEWNDPMADFELQFVSPEKKFFQLSHNIFGDRELIHEEISAGYSIMEFAIDDAEPGEWMVNLYYRGDQDALNPTVLKYTIYTDFGLTTETKEIKLVKLQDLKSKVVLDSFVY